MHEVVSMISKKNDGKDFSQNEHDNWNSWKWQIKNTIKEISVVEDILQMKFNDVQRKKIELTIKSFPMAITPYYLSLVHIGGIDNDPIFKQAFPDIRELEISKYDMKDPLAEEKDSPVKGITHRYPDRVLFHISNTCAMYCRHCTRKRKVGDRDCIPSKKQLLEGIEYIKKTPEIRDVLLSGGDPFMLSDEYIDWILNEISQISHVEVIRIGTRTPVVLPQRITNSLIKVLEKYDCIWLNTHFNHPQEITVDAKKALKKLSKAGIVLGNQTVLLSGINDCTLLMKKLVQKLVENRVRPYYIYQCDLSEGLEHFRTSIGKGVEIMETLRGHTSGFAIPTYVVDAPGGGGKIPVGPNYIVSWSGSKIILRNFEGVITTYEEPHKYKENICDLDCENCKLQLDINDKEKNNMIGVERLLSNNDKKITLVPVSIEKKKRNIREFGKNA
mgnify:CR=1 FL=1